MTSLAPAIAVRATTLGASFHKDLHDRIIVAAALARNAALVTADQELHEARLVQTVW